MEVHAVDVDDVRCFLERFLDIAIFPDAIPDFVRAGLFVKDAVVFERLLSINHRVERVVLYCDEFGGIVGQARGFRHNRCHRLSLIARLLYRHRVVANLLSVIGTNFDKRMGLRGDFFTGDRADYAGQSFRSCGINANDASMRVWRTHKA